MAVCESFVLIIESVPLFHAHLVRHITVIMFRKTSNIIVRPELASDMEVGTVCHLARSGRVPVVMYKVMYRRAYEGC